MPVFVILLTVGLTYAYFSGGITGNETEKDIKVQMGNLSLFYDSGEEIKVNNSESHNLWLFALILQISVSLNIETLKSLNN